MDKAPKTTSRTHNNLGVQLAGSKRFDAAIVHYRKALEIKPGYAEVRQNYGLALAEQGQLDEAMGYFRKALAIRPDFAEAHDALAVALAKRGEVDEAIVHFNRAWRSSRTMRKRMTIWASYWRAGEISARRSRIRRRRNRSGLCRRSEAPDDCPGATRNGTLNLAWESMKRRKQRGSARNGPAASLGKPVAGDGGYVAPPRDSPRRRQAALAGRRHWFAGFSCWRWR